MYIWYTKVVYVYFLGPILAEVKYYTLVARVQATTLFSHFVNSAVPGTVTLVRKLLFFDCWKMANRTRFSMASK